MPRLVCTIPFAALLLVAVGCREDTPSPTAPESAPALATTATAALAFYQVSAGSFHTCGVTTDNRAFCWGFYNLGPGQALGDGSPNASLTPVAVAGGLLFRQVSAGFAATCGVTWTTGLSAGAPTAAANLAMARPPCV
jgi:hypothetical protein